MEEVGPKRLLRLQEQAAFLRSRPSLLLQLPEDVSRRGEAWPSPRTWDYASRLIARASESKISRLTGLPIYQQMTIRNWATTTKLLALMSAARE